jgi:hypothetical protein
MAGSYDGSIRINTEIDASTAEAGLNQLSGDLKNFAGMVAAAFSVSAIISFGQTIIETTASLQALGAQFDQIFKGEDNAAAMAAITKQSEDLGIHVDRLTSSYSKFGSQLKGAGMDMALVMNVTDQATRIAADAAAFYDMTLEDATSSISSFMKGNFEAGDAIGVFTNATQMDIKAKEHYNKAWQDLTEAERQWLLLDTVKKTYEMSGATGQAAREQGNWANVTANLKATWAEFLELIGSPILAAAVSIVQGITEKLNDMMTAIKENKELFTVIGIVIAGVTVAIIAYNIALNITTISTTIATVATAAFGAAMAFITSPITLVILAITALIVIVYLLIDNWEEIKEAAVEIWTAIADFFTGLWESITGALTKAWDAIADFFTGLWEDIKGIWTDAATWFETKVFQPIKNAFASIGKAIADIWQGIWNVIRGIINIIISGVEGFVNAIIFGINLLIEGINALLSLITALPQALGFDVDLSIPTIGKVNLPRLAKGAVIPPNREFLAVLGDQRSGRNIEAPEGLIRDIIADELGKQNFSIDAKLELGGTMGQFVRYMQPKFSAEANRRGRSATKGTV